MRVTSFAVTSVSRDIRNGSCNGRMEIVFPNPGIACILARFSFFYHRLPKQVHPFDELNQ